MVLTIFNLGHLSDIGCWGVLWVCLSDPLHQKNCLAWWLLYSVNVPDWFKICFKWYLQYLIQVTCQIMGVEGYLGVSGRPFAADNLSCMGNSLIYGIYLLLWNCFCVVPPMFDLDQISGSLWVCLPHPLQQTFCLAWAIWYSEWYTQSCLVGFRWYLQCLI